MNVKEIKDIFLYTKDDYGFSYLKVHDFNIDLLSIAEKMQISRNLAKSFDGDRKDYVYCTLPREVDLESYHNNIKNTYNSEMTSLKRKRLLNLMYLEGHDVATNGENFEHQHFLRIWGDLSGDKSNALSELKTRIKEFHERYLSVGIKTEILHDTDIIKLCNLFGNASQSSYEIVPKNTILPEIPMLA